MKLKQLLCWFFLLSLPAHIFAGGGGGGGVKILSQPQIITQFITTRDDFFEQLGADYAIPNFNQADIKFREIGTKLVVIPNVNQAESEITNDITVREMDTQLVVRDGDTVVLGGLLNDTVETEDQSRIPWLSKLPYVSLLFKNRAGRTTDQELLVFIQARIIDTEQE